MSRILTASARRTRINKKSQRIHTWRGAALWDARTPEAFARDAGGGTPKNAAYRNRGSTAQMEGTFGALGLGEESPRLALREAGWHFSYAPHPRQVQSSTLTREAPSSLPGQGLHHWALSRRSELPPMMDACICGSFRFADTVWYGPHFVGFGLGGVDYVG